MGLRCSLVKKWSTSWIELRVIEEAEGIEMNSIGSAGDEEKNGLFEQRSNNTTVMGGDENSLQTEPDEADLANQVQTIPKILVPTNTSVFQSLFNSAREKSIEEEMETPTRCEEEEAGDKWQSELRVTSTHYYVE